MDNNRHYIYDFGSNGIIEVAYNEFGQRVLVDMRYVQLNEHRWHWLWQNLPMLQSDIREGKYEKYTVKAKPMDLSFEAFWEIYGYKVGKKGRAQMLWKELKSEEKVQCLMAIPKYKRWLNTKQNIERVFPETFLSQRRFENEFLC